MRLPSLTSLVVCACLLGVPAGVALVGAPAPAVAKAKAGNAKPAKGKPKPKQAVRGTEVTSPVDLGALRDAPCPDATLQPTPEVLDRVRAATHCLVNAARTQQSVPPLSEERLLRGAADIKAADMVAHGYFTHTTPGGQTFQQLLTQVGYAVPGTKFHIAESLAWGQTYRGTPLAIVTGWLNSPMHRDNILSRSFTQTGIGVVMGVPSSETKVPLPGATFVQEFGYRRLGSVG